MSERTKTLEGLQARIDKLTEELDGLTEHYAKVRREAVNAGEVKPQPAEQDALQRDEIAEAEAAMGTGSARDRHIAMSRSMSLKVARMKERKAEQSTARAVDFTAMRRRLGTLPEEGDE